MSLVEGGTGNTSGLLVVTLSKVPGENNCGDLGSNVETLPRMPKVILNPVLRDAFDGLDTAFDFLPYFGFAFLFSMQSLQLSVKTTALPGPTS